MKILIEEHTYGNSDAKKATEYDIAIAKKVREILGPDFVDPESTETSVHVSQVGYFYNDKIEDCVFILPKVVLNEKERVFAINGKEGYAPEDLIDFEPDDLQDDERQFIFELSTWVYRAICVYNDNTPESDNFVYEPDSQMNKSDEEGPGNTMLDIILALLEFYRKNQDYVFYVLRNIHSGYNKINWTKTIAHSTAFIQEGTPVYLDVVNKKRQINFDEELLIIFYSILNYVKEHYGFPVQLNVNFNLITSEMFENYLDGIGETRLLQIKYKYFSDKDLYLWKLCYSFFTRKPNINTDHPNNDKMVVKKFDKVFEDIMDELIGDKIDSTKQPRLSKLKNQENQTKLLDHIYRYKDLITGRDIYYIGDSKYYKEGHKVSGPAEDKQFIYARNAIEWYFDLFNNGTKEEQATLSHIYDSDTEGFNILPNFFISAHQNELKEDPFIRPDKTFEKEFIRYHQKNRLFDIGTLLVGHFDVNFLYVVSLYARDDASEKGRWKETARALIRKNLRLMFDAKYEFYVLSPKQDKHTEARKYIHDNLKALLGKIYGYKGKYVLALEKSAKNDSILALFQNTQGLELFKKIYCRSLQEVENKLLESGNRTNSDNEENSPANIIELTMTIAAEPRPYVTE